MEAPSLDLGLDENASPPRVDAGFAALGGPGDGEPFQKAMHKAGALLSSRARTEHELRERLLAAGFGPTVAGSVVNRLKDLRLLDDLEYSRAWVEERSRRKGLAGAALVNELIAKGIEPETAERAKAEACLDEDAMAGAVAARLFPKMRGLPLRAQVSRLQGALARRGFGTEAVEAGMRSVLPPEGWD